MNSNGFTALIAIILILLIIYMIMRARSSRIKKRMDESGHFRRRRE